MMTSDPLKLGVLISGSGSNLQAIIDAIETGQLDARVEVVISSKADAFGLVRAREHGIEGVWIDREEHPDASSYNGAIRDELQGHGVDYVVMAGYMRLLGTEVLDAFPHRVLNLHPALLPSFPGAHGIADAFAAGVKITGITVHFADEVFDQGPIIAQHAVEIASADTLESLETKIHEAEHRLYPAVLQLIAQGRVRVDGRFVHIEDS